MTIADLVAEASSELDYHVSSSTDECLKCNVCNTVCPVLRVTDLFAGAEVRGPPGAAVPHGPRPADPGPDEPQVQSPDHSVDYCSGCGWCTTACPAGVKIAEMNNQARARLREGKWPQDPRLGARPDRPHGLAGRRLLAAGQLRLRQRAHPGG